jgi:glycosyltransferase involved in cell wall biosynthesis
MTTLRVHIHPERKSLSDVTNGVDMCNYHMRAGMERYGVSIVPMAMGRDLLATHIFYPGKEPAEVLHCHGLYPTGMQQIEGWAWDVNEKVISAARAALLVTVPAPWVAELFARDMGFVPRVVPHGIDVANWPERTVGQRTPIVLWNKNREIDVCSPAPMNQLAELTPNVRYISTFGEPADNVRITGSVPHTEMVKLLYEAGVYLATTKETFGIGILEALAAGLPVLGYRWGALPDIVRHEREGYLAEPGDIEGLRDGLRYILQDHAALSAAARKRAEHYTWDAASALYAQAYHEAYALKVRRGAGKVAVVIPCYNYAHWVSEAIRSVQAQTLQSWECVVVDDGSTDGSVQAIRKAIAEDKRFRLLEQKNQGVAAARNAGAAATEGEFLVFLDADDRMRPDCLQALQASFRNRPTLGLAYGKLAIINDHGAVVTETSGWPERFSVEGQLGHRNQVPSCCMLRRVAFERAGGFRQHTAPAEDAELWARIPLLGFEVEQTVRRTVYDYRMHKDSATSRIREGGKKEPDWLAYLPATQPQGHVPFASIQKPVGGKKTHAVLNYDEPAVSIIIPCGDLHRDLLADALESVAAQIDPRWECVVVDDTKAGGLEQHGALPYALRYPWVHWVRNADAQRGNVSAARNAGVRASHGKWLCFLDADDFLDPHYLQETLPLTEECPEGGELYYTDWISLPNGKEHHAARWDVRQLKQLALFAVTFVHSRRAFDAIGGFDESLLLWEDWDYAIRLALAGCVGRRVAKPLFSYRYDTGRRREESLEHKDQLIQTFRRKYEAAMPEGEMG